MEEHEHEETRRWRNTKTRKLDDRGTRNMRKPDDGGHETRGNQTMEEHEHEETRRWRNTKTRKLDDGGTRNMRKPDDGGT